MSSGKQGKRREWGWAGSPVPANHLSAARAAEYTIADTVRGPDDACSPGVELAEGFVEDDASGGGQVEAADLAGRHGNAHDSFGVPLQEPRRQAVGFAAEEEAIVGLIRDAGVGPLGSRAQAHEPMGRHGLLEVFERVV